MGRSGDTAAAWRLRSPLRLLAPIDERLLLRRAGAATFMTFLVQFATGWPLKLPDAAGGIISLELAGSASRASEVLDAWQQAGLTGLATANVILDFSFLISYSALLTVLAVRAGRDLGRAERLGWGVGWGMWAAGGLDAVENVALLLMLAGSVTDLIAGTAKVLAVSKFALIGLGLAWVATAHLARLSTRKPTRGDRDG